MGKREHHFIREVDFNGSKKVEQPAMMDVDLDCSLIYGVRYLGA